MNQEQLAKLLQQLAQSLGTTVEHLWGVLLRQAPISVGITLFWCTIAVAGWWIYAKQFKRVAAHISELSDDDKEFELVVKCIGWCVFGLFLLCLSFGCVFMIENSITAIFNPEYWALEQLLNKIDNLND